MVGGLLSHIPCTCAPQATPLASVDNTSWMTLILCYGPHGRPIVCVGGLAQKCSISLSAGAFKRTSTLLFQPAFSCRQLYRSTKFSRPPIRAGEQL